MKGAKPLVLALAAAAVLPAGASAAQRTSYRITDAAGFERVTFTADLGTCAQFGTCADSGTVEYRFGDGSKRGGLVTETSASGRTKGTASFRSKGKTTASVTSVNGDCRDTVNHGSEWFTLNTPGSRLSKLLFTFHPRTGTRDYLRTDCVGPNEASLARGHALPAANVPAKNFRNHARTSFRTTGHDAFTDRGYSGTVRWDLRYKIVRRGG